MEKLDIKKLAKKETKAKVTAYAIIVGTILVLYTLSMIYVVGWGLLASLKHRVQFTTYPAALPDLTYFARIPNRVMLHDGTRQVYNGINGFLANYEMVFGAMHYQHSEEYFTGIFTQTKVYKAFEISGVNAFFFFLWNSVLTVFAGTALPIYLCCIMGYLTANYKYKFSGFIYALVLFTMIIPIIGTGATMLNFQKQIGIYDNMVGFFIWNCQFTSMYFLIMFSFFQGLSATYFEAAEIDGASQMRLILSIAIPMANTMIWAGVVSLVITTWNDYMTPLTYLPSYPTLSFGIFYQTRTNQFIKSTQPAQIAALFLLAIPAVVFFTAFRKKLMGNISIGGIKG